MNLGRIVEKNISPGQIDFACGLRSGIPPIIVEAVVGAKGNPMA